MKALLGLALVIAALALLIETIHEQRIMDAYQAGECREFKQLGYHTCQGGCFGTDVPLGCQLHP